MYSRYLPSLILFITTLQSHGRDIHVDPAAGDDSSATGPVRTIARAIKLAQAGDTIHLEPRVYRDYAGFYGKRGAPGKPIILAGHGATLDGSEPLDPKQWTETKPGLFRCDDLLRYVDDAIIHRWYFLWDGHMNRMGRVSKGKSEPLKKPEDLKPGEWTFVKDPSRKMPKPLQIAGSFYLKLPSGQKLSEAQIFVPVRSAGVQFSASGTNYNAHLIIRNLTATHVYNDGFNIHGHCEDVRFENIRAIECGDDGISAHETAEYVVDGFASIGNATGICDTGRSRTDYRNVFIKDCLGFDLYFIGLQHSLENALIESRADRAFWLDGRHLPENQSCSLSMSNVVLRRVGGPQEMRIGIRGKLQANHCSVHGLNITLTPGAESELRHCLVSGDEKHVMLYDNAVWHGDHNRYDVDHLRVKHTRFKEPTFDDFRKLTGSDKASKWGPEVAFAQTGANEASLDKLRPSSRAQVSVNGGPQVSEAVLFAFDDHSIPWRDNLKVTPITAEKHLANPVVRRGPKGAPDHGHAILYGSVLRIGGKFRMWYLGMFETDLKSGQAPGWWRPMCYAESDDGVNWTKPDLGLVEFNGNRQNNICLVESEVPALAKVNDFLSVMYEPNDPDPQRRYKCAYIAHPPFDDVRGGRSGIGPNERRWGAFICATSPDGLSWKVVGDRPMNAGGERYEVSGLYRFGNFYYAPGQLINPWAWRADGSAIGRVMLTYRSADFENWSGAKATSFARPGQLASTPIKGQQTHMGAGLWNRGNAIVGLYGRWQDAEKKPADGRYWNTGVTIDLGLLVSNDGIHFREPVPDHPVIPLGGENEWDNIALLQGHAFANVGDRTLMWYSHWDTGGKLRNMEIGLASLRRDGFAHLSRNISNSRAQFVTTTFETDGKARLYLNVEGVSDRQPLSIELLDDFDHPLAGFSGQESARAIRSGTRQEVRWKRPFPIGRKLAVKVTYPSAGNVKVYAIYIGE